MLIEHDRWKTEAILENNLQVEEIRALANSKYSSKNSGASSISTQIEVSESDLKFNELSSYGKCTEKQLGLISKTNVWYGANERSADLIDQWTEHVQQNNIVPLKDLKDGRLKNLLLNFLWASGCAHRAQKWPDARDANQVKGLKKDLQERLCKFSKQTIVAAYESLKEFWKQLNDYESVPFNSTLIADVLDDAYQSVQEKARVEASSDIKNSPLFCEFSNHFEHIPLTSLEKYYIKNRKNFLSAGIGALRKHFITNQPDDLDQKFSSNEWARKWHIYLPSYEEKWMIELKDIYNSTKPQQEQWKTSPQESTSSPTPKE